MALLDALLASESPNGGRLPGLSKLGHYPEFG
jgi:hypothetical protein